MASVIAIRNSASNSSGAPVDPKAVQHGVADQSPMMPPTPCGSTGSGAEVEIEQAGAGDEEGHEADQAQRGFHGERCLLGRAGAAPARPAAAATTGSNTPPGRKIQRRGRRSRRPPCRRNCAHAPAGRHATSRDRAGCSWTGRRTGRAPAAATAGRRPRAAVVSARQLRPCAWLLSDVRAARHLEDLPSDVGPWFRAYLAAPDAPACRHRH